MTVLIVDHLADRRSELAEAIRQLGHEVRSVADGDSALMSIVAGGIAVVLADLRLPGMDGIKLLKEIKVKAPATQVVLMGADASAKEYKAALEAGATEVVTSEVTSENVDEAIKKALDQHQGHFTGLVHGLSLTDILQMLHFTRRTATVRFGEGSARIHLSEGEILHAVSGDLSGKPALRAILTRRSGAFFTAPPEPFSASIDEGLESLLLDLMRDIDESSRPFEAAPRQPSSDLPTSKPTTVDVNSGDIEESDGATEVQSADLEPIESSGPVAPPPELVDEVASIRPIPPVTAPPAGTVSPFVVDSKTPTEALEADPADEPDGPVELPKRNLTWIWAVAAVLLAASGWLLMRATTPPTEPDRGLTGERIEVKPLETPPVDRPPPAPEPQPATSTVAVATPPPPTSIEAASPSAARRVTVTTRPPGLLLIDTGTSLPLGNSPLEVPVPQTGDLAVRARLGTRTTPDLHVRVRPDQAEVELDLRSWVLKTRAPPPTK